MLTSLKNLRECWRFNQLVLGGTDNLNLTSVEVYSNICVVEYRKLEHITIDL
jgi:hypothetical protein